jgi:hypothetical protein
MPKRMTIAKIRLDFQPPENLIEENVLYFVNKFRLREKVEPVLVYCDGTDYRLYDGFHRVAAAIRPSNDTGRNRSRNSRRYGRRVAERAGGNKERQRRVGKNASGTEAELTPGPRA